MITVPAGVRVLLATRPVDFRKGAHGLAALASAVLGEDPFSGVVVVFRAKRGQRPTFCIQFALCDGCLSMAPAGGTDVSGLAFPSRQGPEVHLHG